MKKYFIILFQISLFLNSNLASPANSQVLNEQGCDVCHALKQTDLKSGTYSAPSLFFAGDKFNGEWLKKFLTKPEVLRETGYTNDPGFLLGKTTDRKSHIFFDEADAVKITEALLKLKDSPSSEIPVNDSPLSKGKRARAKLLFERDYSCIACHKSVNLLGKPRGGVSGPSLVHAGDRLKINWVYQFLQNPKHFEPKGRMPIFKLDKDTLLLLVKYVMSHKSKISN